MPDSAQSASIDKILPKIKRLLDKATLSIDERDVFLAAIRENPGLVVNTMKDSLQHRLIERNKPILDKLKHPTPYMETLRNAYHSSRDESHKKTVSQLLSFELKDKDKTALMAWRAVILSAEANVPPPPWAGKFFEQILDGYITGEVRDLAVAFGLKGSRGRDSEYCKERLRLRDHELSKHVRSYCLQGVTVRKACSLVANLIAEQYRTGAINETIYTLIPMPFNSKTFTQTLEKKIYPRWLSQQSINCTLDGIDHALNDQLREVRQQGN